MRLIAVVLWLTIALLLAFVGICAHGMLNGQLFANSLICIGCLALSTGICVLASRDANAARPMQYLWGLAAGGFFTFAVVVAIQLPSAYRFQEDFNSHPLGDIKFKLSSEQKGTDQPNQ